MRRIATIGLTSALLAASACSAETDGQNGIESGREGAILVSAQHEMVVRTKPNAINDPESVAGVLSAGQLTLAQCYFESATLGSDSVMIDGETADGFVFLWHYDASSTAYTFGEDPTDELQRSLDECTTEETSGVIG